MWRFLFSGLEHKIYFVVSTFDVIQSLLNKFTMSDRPPYINYYRKASSCNTCITSIYVYNQHK